MPYGINEVSKRYRGVSLSNMEGTPPLRGLVSSILKYRLNSWLFRPVTPANISRIRSRAAGKVGVH